MGGGAGSEDKMLEFYFPPFLRPGLLFNEMRELLVGAPSHFPSQCKNARLQTCYPVWLMWVLEI